MSETKNILDTDIKFLKGVGPKRALLLSSELGIKRFEDLLYHFPFRHIDRTQFHNISEIQLNNTAVQLSGKIIKKDIFGKGRANRLTAVLQDETGAIELVWFKGVSWVKDKIIVNDEYLVYGKPSQFGRKLNITHPEIEKVESGYELRAKLQAVYSTTEKLASSGINSRGFNRLIGSLIDNVKSVLYENLNKRIIKKYNLVSHGDAIVNIHLPKSYDDIQKAQFRLKYEEFLFIQLRLIEQNLVRKENIPGYIFDHIGDKFNHFYKNNIPFE